MTKSLNKSPSQTVGLELRLRTSISYIERTHRKQRLIYVKKAFEEEEKVEVAGNMFAGMLLTSHVHIGTRSQVARSSIHRTSN